ncbi:DUF4957 domain-containing protein [Sphingobacterium gobiense]|uniref:Fibronectin type III domain-containing protein n=1 Tax=Sphingobacterium gobiense TaxID=1382456 RepID=A0A2S9JKR2_9SPHI|nr:DUF4957 domain-containing protein [Sphingobacterium gobiense]PRD53745.1 fibronectin type III domain-containing protein [Sphingobacterium gobiense]
MKCKYIIWFSAMIVGLGLSSCKENLLQEITELNLDRALSPTELTAQIVDRTNVRLNWRRVSNAESYNIEIFDNAQFSGTAAATADGVTMDQLPYTISGLEGETIYYVRVQAIGEAINESKWISATFTTDTEQIFNEIDAETLTAESVTLSWPSGEMATEIILTPGDIRHTVTPAEVDAGSVTITGLFSDETYTATLKNGEKTRGTISFTTLLGEGVIKISPEEDLAAVVAAAEEGAILALEPGAYIVNDDLTIKKTITLQGYKPNDKPVIQGAILRISNNAGLTLKDLVLDATGGASDQTVIYNDDDLQSPYGDFVMQDCEVKNYVKGIFYASKKARVLSVTFRNNVIHNIECDGGDFIDFRHGMADKLDFVNNTVYNSAAARDLFRMDSDGSTNFPGVSSQVTISQNTFYNVVSNNSRRYLYIRHANHSISFTKNLIVGSEGYYTNQGATTITALSGNNYHNAPNFTASSVSNAQNDTGNYTSLNPEFTNPEEGDFTVNNLDLKLNGVGAARWR